MKNPSTSVVILNYNGGEDVIECLESVRHIDYPSYEIIVVDNASTDNSVESIRRKFPEVKIVQNETNLGFAEGNNVGIREANSNYVMLLNDDAIVAKNILKDLTAAIEERKDIGMVGPMILYYTDRDRIWFAGGKVSLFGHASNWGKGLPRQSCHSPRPVDFLSGCAVLIKREVIDKIGLLDSTYFLYYEDIDYCLRARKAGYECLYIPSPTVWHKTTANWITNYVQAYYYLKNPIIFARKNLTGYRQLIFIISHFSLVFPYCCLKFARSDVRMGKYLFKGLKDGMAYYFFNKLNPVEFEAMKQ